MNWYVYCGNNPVRFVDPWGLKTYLAVVGEDKASNNNAFMNNVNTFIEDHPDDDVIVINAADYDSEDALMSAIIAESENCAGIDGLLIESHGTTSALIVSSRYSLSCDANWGDIHFNQNATIVFSGCNTGGSDGVVDDNSIAQKVANTTNRTVYAYVNSTSQIAYDKNGKVTNNWKNAVKYYQKPVRKYYNQPVVNSYTQFAPSQPSRFSVSNIKEYVLSVISRIWRVRF